MKPGFMSSVCPEQTLPELIGTATKYGYSGIEFRVEWNHRHRVELSASDAELASVRQRLADSGVEASCVATGAKFNSDSRAEHIEQQGILKQYVELAAKVGAPCLRTFADSVPEDDEAARNTVLGLAAESYAAVNDCAREHGVLVLVETHTNMRAHWARRILDSAEADRLGILWHIGHHVSRGQSVEEAYPHIRGHVQHLHFAAMAEGKVTDADNQRTFELLKPDGFEGYFSVEVINPDDPAAVLRTHIDKFRRFMDAVS